MSRLVQPGLRLPRHRGTTANLAAAYPFHGARPLSDSGPYLGQDISAGGAGWFFDPFELYGRDVGGSTLTNSNMLVVGEPGFGKSAAAKTILWREAGYYGSRRFIAVSDPKGEYDRLAGALDIPVVRLYPGGPERVNPLDRGPGDQSLSLLNRQSLVGGLIAVVLRRDLTAIEETLLTVTIEHLDNQVDAPTLGDLAALLGDLPDVIRCHRDVEFIEPRDLNDARTHLRLALGKLLDRTLRGMFDGHTTATFDWERGPGIVLDLSAVFGNSEALPIVQMAATSWLQTVMADLARQGRRGILVDDEVWATLASERAARHVQARLKLCRLYGIWNILICHRLSDLRAQADDGTAANKITSGLLADIQTKVIFRQSPDQAADARGLLQLNDTLMALMTRLARGRALWLTGPQASVVQFVLDQRAGGMFDSDSAMSSARPHSYVPAAGS